MSLRQVIEHLASLIEGAWPAARYPVPAAHFRPTEHRTPLESYPVTGRDRRYELLWMRVSDGQPTVGESNVSGNIVDSNAELELVIAYHAGGGTGGGDRQTVNRNAADDWTRLRRCLVHGANYDEVNTGLENLRFGRATIAPSRGNPDLVLMTIPLLVQYREDWTLEPAA